MARKAIVDRNTVLQLLKESKTSQSIATQFGVSRQAIDLYRKEFIRTGLLQGAASTPALPVTMPAPTPPTINPPVSAKPTLSSAKPPEVSLDQMIELFIKALDALKRLPELEDEVVKFRNEHEGLLQQITQLEEREQKRKEQETRWLQTQNQDNVKS